MRRVGTVRRVAGGVAVARAAADEPPAVGDEVVDETLDVAGRVVSVFGPVERPYVAVSPAEGRAAADLFDEPLYAR